MPPPPNCLSLSLYPGPHLAGSDAGNGWNAPLAIYMLRSFIGSGSVPRFSAGPEMSKMVSSQTRDYGWDPDLEPLGIDWVSPSIQPFWVDWHSIAVSAVSPHMLAGFPWSKCS